MNIDDRERASVKAQAWRALEGAALGKVEEMRGPLRRAGEYTGWLEEQWARERELRIQLEREAAQRALSDVHSGLDAGEIARRMEVHLRRALERTPQSFELALGILARPLVQRAIRDTLAICLRAISSDGDRAYVRAEAEALERDMTGGAS